MTTVTANHDENCVCIKCQEEKIESIEASLKRTEEALGEAVEALEWALERVPGHAKGVWWDDFRVHLLVVHRALTQEKL